MSLVFWIVPLMNFGQLTAQTVNVLPRSVSLISDFQKHGLTALDQGKRGDCSLFAITGLVEFEIDQYAPGVHPRLSEDYLIWAADEATGQTGDQAMFYKAVQGLNEWGICNSADLPYLATPDPTRKPSAAAIANARQWRERWQVEWIKRWSYSALSEVELTEIKRAIAAGHPVACGLRWPKGLKGSELLDVPTANQVFDGHSIVLVGYEEAPAKPGGGVFLFRNSFGPNWGDQGYGTMSFAYAKTYANDAVWLRLGTPDSEIPTERYEAESMPIRAAERCKATPQQMNAWGAKMWSHGEQLFCLAEKGGFVELGFAVPHDGRYRIRILGTAAPDYGRISFALDGRNLMPEFDLYSGQVSPAGSLELGIHELPAGEHRIRVTVRSKNAAAENYFFGLDALDLMVVK
jgi:Papain family cysteine protease